MGEIKVTVPGAKLTFVECDLASLASVEQTAKHFIAKSQRLDILMCNAGIMALPPALTKDGYEIQFGTNHIGHALLIKLLLPTLLRTAEQPECDVRVISNTSRGAFGVSGIDFKTLCTTQDRAFGHWLRYSQSKLANVLYTAELARRYPTIKFASIHPGVINTGLVSNLGMMDRALVSVTNIGSMLTPEQGAYNQLWAATTHSDFASGAYYEPVGKLGTLNKTMKDRMLAEQLWDWTETELTLYKA